MYRLLTHSLVSYFFFFVFTVAFMGYADHACARQPYSAVVAVDTTTVTVTAPNLVDLNRELKTTSLEALAPVYTPQSPVAINIDLRGIDLFSSFAANSTTLVVAIPQTGVKRTFTGGTRDESLTLLKDFIRDGGVHGELFRAYARYSPIDPIAGNPISLMAGMAQADYLLGHLSPFTGCDCSWSSQPLFHQFQMGAYGARAFSQGFDTTTVTLPTRYSYTPDLNWAFFADVPVTYNRNGGASSLFTSVGMGIRMPLTQDWSLTSVLRMGTGGSLDLCTAGCFFSTGVMSVFNYKLADYVLSMTNYASYVTSTNLWLTGINFNYHLHNYIFKNGLSFTSCCGWKLLGRPVNFGLSFIDSCFAREHLFIKHYDEIGIALIANGINPCLDYDCLSLSFSYQFGQKRYRGYCLNTTYQF